MKNPYAKGTFFGNYELVGAVDDARIVTAHEFAVPRTGNGVFHEKMAEYIARDVRLMALPKKLNHFVAAALIELEPGIQVDIFDGISTDMVGNGEGTQGEVTQLKAHMLTEFGQVVPSVHIGHARHIGRVVAQSRVQGLEPITLEGYPDGFDPESIQGHVHGPWIWGLHELIGVPYLHVAGKF
jgi:hypothetical protein